MIQTTKKIDPLKKLREIIRQEVRAAIKEEMVPFLMEIIKSTATGALLTEKKKSTSPIVPSFLSGIKPSTNTVNVPKPGTPRLLFPNGNTQLDLLEETRREMIEKAGLSDSDFIQQSTTAPLLTEENPGVTSMIQSAGKSSREEFVEINNVPDFSKTMKRMNL